MTAQRGHFERSPAEVHSQVYAMLADRSSMPDGDVWEHEPLRRLAADVTALLLATPVREQEGGR